MDRFVEHTIPDEWGEAEDKLERFLESVGVVPKIAMAAVWLDPVLTADAPTFGRQLAASVDSDETWAMLVTNPGVDGQCVGFALPVQPGHPMRRSSSRSWKFTAGRSRGG